MNGKLRDEIRDGIAKQSAKRPFDIANLTPITESVTHLLPIYLLLL